jgi:hypothetical protein
VAEENKQNNKGLRVGRRLYLYFAGRGFGPKLDESALLTANATPSRVRYHIAGRSWADWFHVANYFDEVVLFMDCCRNVFSNAPINAVGYGNIIGPRQGRRFYAFGTKWRRVTWERMMGDGKAHGVFTTALLAGLNGAAADAATGEVSAKTLREYLINYMKDYFAPEDRLNPDVDPEPDIPDLDNAGGLVFCQLTPPTYPITLKPRSSAAGKMISILNDKFAVVNRLQCQPIGLCRGRFIETRRLSANRRRWSREPFVSAAPSSEGNKSTSEQSRVQLTVRAETILRDFLGRRRSHST